MSNRKLCEKYIGIPYVVHYNAIDLEYIICEVSNGLVKYTYRAPNSKRPNLIFSGRADCALIAHNIRFTLRGNNE